MKEKSAIVHKDLFKSGLLITIFQFLLFIAFNLLHSSFARITIKGLRARERSLQSSNLRKLRKEVLSFPKTNQNRKEVIQQCTIYPIGRVYWCSTAERSHPLGNVPPDLTLCGMVVSLREQVS